jgi:hypothetical protein
VLLTLAAPTIRRLLWVTVVIVCADVYTAQTSWRYQFVAQTIQTAKERYIYCFGSADCPCCIHVSTDLPLAAHTIISCQYYYILLLWCENVECSIQDGGLNKWQKNAHHHTPIQLPSVDVTPDPPTFSLDTTFKVRFQGKIVMWVRHPAMILTLIPDGWERGREDQW